MKAYKEITGIDDLSVGDLFLIPLEDCSEYTVGQILAVVPELLDSVVCCYFDVKVGLDDRCSSEKLKNPIAVQFTTSDLLLSGYWRVIGSEAPLDIREFFDLPDLERQQFIGVDVRGSRNMSKFVTAFLGLYPWNCYYRDDYLDEILLDGVQKPDRIYCS